MGCYSPFLQSKCWRLSTMFWKPSFMWLYICACKEMQFGVQAQKFLKLVSQNLMLYLISRRRRSSASLSGSSSSSSSSRSRSPPKKAPKRTVSSPPRKTRRLSPSASPPRRRHRPSPPASPPPKPRRSPTPQQSNRARKSRGSVSPSRASGKRIKSVLRQLYHIVLLFSQRWRVQLVWAENMQGCNKLWLSYLTLSFSTQT